MFRDAINVLFQLGKNILLGRKKSFKIPKNVLRSRKSKKIQWSKEKGQKDKQWYTNNTKKNTEWATRTPLTTVSDGMCSKKISSYPSSNGTVVLFLLNRLYVMNKEITANGKYSWSFVTHIFRCRHGHRKSFEVIA
jgi:hypothetical protein